jgi:alkylation response protein AidB-like acyl-CoA dehydrogenase
MTLEREAPAAVAEPDDDVFRARLREFFTACHPGRPPKDPRERLPWTKAWLATLFDRGYAGPRWPREFGGCAGPSPAR